MSTESAAQTAENSPLSVSVIEQLLRMGFNEQQIIRASYANPIRAQEGQSRYIQRLVSWLIDHPVSDDNEGEEGNEDDDDDDLDADYEMTNVADEVCVIYYFFPY